MVDFNRLKKILNIIFSIRLNQFIIKLSLIELYFYSSSKKWNDYKSSNTIFKILFFFIKKHLFSRLHHQIGKYLYFFTKRLKMRKYKNSNWHKKTFTNLKNKENLVQLSFYDSPKFKGDQRESERERENGSWMRII